MALLRDGQAQEALTVVDGIANRSPSAESLYVEILQTLGLTDRLVALWQDEINRADVSADRRRELVYNLLGANADAVAWPHMLTLAKTEGGAWWFALADAALKLGRGADAGDAILEAIGRRPADDTQVPGLLAALESADPKRAPDALRILAARAPALWADSYAYVLRQGGRIDELNRWLTTGLAASTDPAEALVLAQRLAETSPPLEVARLIRPRAIQSRPWAELYVDLLRRGGHPGEATNFLIALAEVTSVKLV